MSMMASLPGVFVVVVVVVVVSLSMNIGVVWGQDYTFPDNTTFWVNGTRYLMYFTGTSDWLDSTTEPQPDFVDFTDTRRAGESVAVHYAWHQMVISERGTKTIAVYQPTTSRAVFAHVGTSPRVGHVTVDWLSNNVYWTDPGFGWIGLQALKQDLSTFVVNARLKVVVSSSLKSPYGVTVLPEIKRLFWSDHGTPPKLESSDLVGLNRRVLVWQGLARPTAVCADHTSRRLYWVDEAKGTVESCDDQGDDRRIVISLQGSSLGGLQVFENYIIVSERNSNELQAYKKDTGRKAANPVTDIMNPGDVVVFSSALQPGNSVTCDSASCDQICIHGEGCACASGYTLAADGKSCTERATSLWKSFLVSNGTRVCAIPINLLFSHPYLPPSHISDTILCFVDAPGIRYLAVDSQNATLFYTSGRGLQRFRIHTGSDELVYTASGDIFGMAYDWLTGTVVWTQQAPDNSVYSMTPGDAQPVAVYQNLNNPSHVTVDSYRGCVFWLERPDGGLSAQIWSGTVNGSQNKVSVLSSGLTKPHYLTYDHKTDRLYWLDDGDVGVIDTDGRNKHVVPLSSLATYGGLAIFRSYVVWSTKASGQSDVNMTFRNAEFTESDDLTSFSLPSKIDDVVDLVLYDASVNFDSRLVSCELDNGGCSQLCIVDGHSHHCRCHFGFRLHQDGVTCTSEQVSKNFFLVADTLMNRVYQINEDNKQVSVVPFQNGAHPELVSYNPATGEVIWYDSEADAIKLSFLDGSSVRVVKSLKEEGQAMPNVVGALCVDQATNNLFFTEIRADDSRGWIRVVSLESLVMRMLHESATPPRLLAIAPSQGRLVFGTVSGTIYLSDIPMEDTPSQLQSGVTSLSGLVFSNDGTTVEWSDDEQDGLWRMPLSTRVPERRLHSSSSHPSALHAWGATLYFLTASGRTINALNNSGTESTVVQYPEFGQLSSLYFFGQQTPDGGRTVCSERNGRCSTLCLPTPNSGRQCQCADGVSLLEDKRTCSDVERCTSEVRNGHLLTSCDRYPAETCAFTCNEGYGANPNAPYIRCSASGHWNVSTDSLCLRACSRRVRNGQMSEECPLVAGESCAVECDGGFSVAETTLPKVECKEDGEWSVSSDAMCIEAEGDTLPVYAIAIISAGAVAIVAVLIGCCLYRRWKRFGGRDSSRHLGMMQGNEHPGNPAIVVTPEVGATGGKQVDEDSRSEVYEELDDVVDEKDRYHSFSRISPNPGKKPMGRSRSPLPNGAVYNEAFEQPQDKDLKDQACYLEPAREYTEPDYHPYSRSLTGQVPSPRHGETTFSSGSNVTPGRLWSNGGRDYLTPQPRPQPHGFHPASSAAGPGKAASFSQELEPTPDYLEVLPPAPQPGSGADVMPLRKLSKSDWTA